MSANVHEDPTLAMNVRHAKVAREDRGDRQETLVDIDESADAFVDRRVDVSTQDRGARSQRQLPVRRNPFRTAPLILGLLYLLLIVGMTVLSRFYASAVLRENPSSNRTEKVQTNTEKVQTRTDDLNCQSGKGNQTQTNTADWTRFRCSCYYASSERTNWTESRTDCQNRGADLVIINNKDEHDFVSRLNKGGESWIGLMSVKKGKKDWGKENEWKWVDSSPLQHMAWKTGVELNPKDESKVYIDVEGYWNHIKTGSKHWICERGIY